MGRKVTNSENLTMRVGYEAKKRWADAATLDGRTLTEWARRVLDAAAEKASRKKDQKTTR